MFYARHGTICTLQAETSTRYLQEVHRALHTPASTVERHWLSRPVGGSKEGAWTDRNPSPLGWAEGRNRVVPPRATLAGCGAPPMEGAAAARAAKMDGESLVQKLQ
jgi:hypothetical protein